MYDDYLRPTGLTIGQYSALAALYYVPSMPMNKLANRLEMDRTTLTRSLAILERDRLISIEPDPEDSRVRAISITNSGLQKLAEAFPLWESAQEAMANMLGARPLKEFRWALDQSIESLKTYVSP
jgi:DNA-binding MarR family transcriptional regulator